MGNAFAFEIVGTSILVLFYYMLVLMRPRVSPHGLLAIIDGNQCADGKARFGTMGPAYMYAMQRACCPAHMLGFAFAAISLSGALISGASFDCYRQLYVSLSLSLFYPSNHDRWPALFSAAVPIEHTWIYLVGPLLGVLIARIFFWLHRVFFLYDATRMMTNKGTMASAADQNMPFVDFMADSPGMQDPHHTA